MTWHKQVVERLSVAGLFSDVALVGGKVRATLDDARFLDVHYDPLASSYSYALIDLTLPYVGDKRLFGWDDYPHEGFEEFKLIAGYPHHFQSRASDGSWVFEESPMRGNLSKDIEIVIQAVREQFE